MTIASDLGFEIGKAYRVVAPDAATRKCGVKAGDFITFVRDDGSACPKFRFNGREFWAWVADDDRGEVLPETQEVHEEGTHPTKWRIASVFRTPTEACRPQPGEVVTREAEFESKQAASGVMVVVRTADDYLRTICSSLLEEVQDLPDHSAKIAELGAENQSIAKQVENMRRRINKKLEFSAQNSREIERLRKEQRGD